MKDKVTELRIQYSKKDEDFIFSKLEKIQELSKQKKDIPYSEIHSLLRVFRKHQLRLCEEQSKDFKEKKKLYISQLHLKYEFLVKEKYVTNLTGKSLNGIHTYTYDRLISDIIKGYILETKTISKEQDIRVEICKRVIVWCKTYRIPIKKFSHYKRQAVSGDLVEAFGFRVLNGKDTPRTATNFQNVMEHHYKKAMAELRNT